MRIKKIKIEKIRGIDSREISLDLHPNTPSFFVAPNGFGKTSIATVFKSMNRKRIEVQDEDRYQNDSSNLPLLEIIDEQGHVYRANSTSNEISDVFSICVINSQVKPKASTRKFGGISSSSPSLIVEPIVLYNTIPKKSEFKYSFSTIRTALGPSAGKLLINFNANICDPIFVRHLFFAKSNFLQLLQKRNSKKIDEFLSKINSLHGTESEIASNPVDVNDLFEIEAINTIIEQFNYLFKELSTNAKLVNVIQLRELYCENSEKFSDIISYYNFVSDKNEINDLLNFFNCTWKGIKASKSGSQFIIEFPKANQISNGERDILCFIGKLFEARKVLSKDKAILIIDEIFDYLDDANLIAAQYFLTKFIAQFKNSEKELFPIILTHLDPVYFNTYNFSTKNVFYLDRTNSTTNKYKINNLLKARDMCKKENKDAYECISSNYLHFSINNNDAAEYIQSIGVETQLQKPEDFRASAIIELENYRNKKDYDPALVCCGLRIYIEKKAYEQLHQSFRAEFFTIFKTVDKLTYAKENGANISEIHFLLSIIYNEAMHLDSQCQKLNPIVCKLRNKVIHSMISEA